MPNTLAHLGVQGLTTRFLLKDADYKWIYLGCIIPDLSWIFRRIMLFAIPGINLYNLQLYVIVQASFCFCLLLSLALAVLSVNYWKTFTILGFNSFFHLFLDACQIKWANGVHLLAPINWHLMNFGLFWPDSVLTYLLTAFGAGYLLYNWQCTVNVPINITCQSLIRLFAFISIIAAYFILPFLIMGIIFTLFSINLFLNPLIYDSFPIIFPSISVLFFFLFAHMVLLGFLSEMIFRMGDFKPKDVKRMSSV